MRRLSIVLLVLAMVSLTGCASYSTLYRPPGATPEGDKDVPLWVFMYPVNRVLDILDVFTVSVGGGAGLYADVHITRAFQLGGGGGLSGFELGWWPRTLGVRQGRILAGHFGPWSTWSEDYVAVGTRAQTARGKIMESGTNRPSGAAFKGHMDYWGIGARVIAVVGCVEVELHPIELADAVTGFFFWDFQHDDIGNTR